MTAMLLNRAIGKRLTCVFVDNGLLRLNEAEQVMEMFAGKFDLNIIHAKAEDRFLNALKGIADPKPNVKLSAIHSLKFLMKKRQNRNKSNGWHRALSIRM